MTLRARAAIISAAGIAALLLSGALGEWSAQSASAEPVDSTWCWSMRSQSLSGTFTMTPAIPGDGSAPAGTYTLTGFSVTASPFAEIPIGAIGSGYEFGSQPAYTISWDGSRVTSWNRLNGTYSNGIGVSRSPALGNWALLFHHEQQAVAVTDTSTTLYSAPIAPAMAPIPATGVCPAAVSFPTTPATAPPVPPPAAPPATNVPPMEASSRPTLPPTGSSDASIVLAAFLTTVGLALAGMAHRPIQWSGGHPHRRLWRDHAGQPDSARPLE